jgi:hypothetical protein
MAWEEGLAEVCCLRMNGIAVNPRRVRGKGGTPGFRPVRGKDVVPDAAAKDRQIGMRKRAA